MVPVFVLLKRGLPLAQYEYDVAVLGQRFFVKHIYEIMARIVLKHLRELGQQPVDHLDLKCVDDAVLLLFGQLRHLAMRSFEHRDEPVVRGRLLICRGWGSWVSDGPIARHNDLSIWEAAE